MVPRSSISVENCAYTLGEYIEKMSCTSSPESCSVWDFETFAEYICAMAYGCGARGVVGVPMGVSSDVGDEDGEEDERLGAAL